MKHSQTNGNAKQAARKNALASRFSNEFRPGLGSLQRLQAVRDDQLMLPQMTHGQSPALNRPEGPAGTTTPSAEKRDVEQRIGLLLLKLFSQTAWSAVGSHSSQGLRKTTSMLMNVGCECKRVLGLS